MLDVSGAPRRFDCYGWFSNASNGKLKQSWSAQMFTSVEEQGKPRTPAIDLLSGVGRGSAAKLFVAFLVAMAVRLIVVGLVYRRFLDPSRGHSIFGWEVGQVARSIVTGNGFANPYWIETGPTTVLTPVYPYIFTAVFAVFGVFTKASALVILGLNSLFSALTSFPIYAIAKRDFSLGTANLALWAWVFFPYSIYFSADSMWYNSLVGLLLTLIFLAAQRLEDSDSVPPWFGLGVLVGFAALTNPVVLAIVPFLGAWLCYRLAAGGHNWAKAAVAGALGLAIALAPWLIRNQRTFRAPVFLKDNFWMEICVGNLNPKPDFWNADVHPSEVPAEMAQFQQLGELGYMQAKKREALNFIQSQPRTFVSRSLRRTLYVWTGIWSFYRPYLRNIPLYLANILILTPLTMISIWGLLTAFKSSTQRAIPYAIVLSTFPIVYYITHADPRYRDPIDPLLVILASSAIVSWLPWKSENLRVGEVPAKSSVPLAATMQR